jgi:hypothetical protein
MFYNARWYDPALGRFAQADTVVPGAGGGNAASISNVADQMYTSLTTGYYETPIINKLNADDLFIQLHGGLLNLSEEDKQRENIVNVPLTALVFDRYSYVKNNSLKHTDPTGHKAVCEEIDPAGCTPIVEVHLTKAELKTLIDALVEFQKDLNTLALKAGLWGAIFGVLALLGLGMPPLAAGFAAVAAGFVLFSAWWFVEVDGLSGLITFLKEIESAAGDGGITISLFLDHNGQRSITYEGAIPGNYFPFGTAFGWLILKYYFQSIASGN